MSIASERGRVAIQKVERDLLRLCQEQQPERVHTFRTSTRRVQTLLAELLVQSDRNQKKLLRLLDGIRKRAGKVRDIDVQIAALRSLKVPQEPRRKTQLMQALLDLRAKHEKRLRKALKVDTIREIRKRLKRAAKRIDLEASRDPMTVARQMLVKVARRTTPLGEEMLHRYRILVKRARYAAEFAPKSTESRQFIAKMKRLQDAIGNWHDWLTLTQSAADRFGDVTQSSLVAEVHNVAGGKFRQAVAVLSVSQLLEVGVKTVPPARPVMSRLKVRAEAAREQTKPAA